MRRPVPALLGLLLIATLVQAPGEAASRPAATEKISATTVPNLRVTRMIGGLTHPWDAKPLPTGRLLVTERSSKRLLTWYAGRLSRVSYDSSTVWAGGETGLMSLAIDPRFSSNRRFYTCQGGRTSGGHDVRVMAWRLSSRATSATLVRRLLTGLPSTSGRHGGCRLLITPDGALIAGTGDAAVGSNPRNLGSLGGKTLRLNRFTGAPWSRNTWIGSSNANARYVLTYGHRNLQGLALRPDGSVWSAEHGPDRDDEVNVLRKGTDYGWHPVPGYNESVPMTDGNLAGAQMPARWRSGSSTVATSGATWVRGRQWGAYEGTLAVAALKGNRVMFLRFNRDGRYVSMRTPPSLRQHGRLRSVTQIAGGDLIVTTADGDGRDAVLRVHPRG